MKHHRFPYLLGILCASLAGENAYAISGPDCEVMKREVAAQRRAGNQPKECNRSRAAAQANANRLCGRGVPRCGQASRNSRHISRREGGAGCACDFRGRGKQARAGAKVLPSGMKNGRCTHHCNSTHMSDTGR